MVNSVFVVVLLISICRLSTQDSSGSQGSSLLNGIVDKGVSGLNGITDTVHQGASGIINSLAESEKDLYQKIKEDISSLKNVSDQLTTSIKESATAIEQVKNFATKVQTCLVKNSLSLPKKIVNELIECVTNPIEDVIKILEDLVTVGKSGLKLIETLQGITDCGDLKCLISRTLSLLPDMISLMVRSASAIIRSIKFMTTDLPQIPTCFQTAVTVQPGIKAAEVGMDILKCVAS